MRRGKQNHDILSTSALNSETSLRQFLHFTNYIDAWKPQEDIVLQNLDHKMHIISSCQHQADRKSIVVKKCILNEFTKLLQYE